MKGLDLRRITTSGSYSPAIDGIRFLAISLVIFQHTFERAVRHTGSTYAALKTAPIADLMASGGVGVSIFFALSAYILYGSMLRASDSAKFDKPFLKKYFSRRASRIVPPYVIAMTLCFLALVATGYRAENGGVFIGGNTPLKDYLYSILYLHNVVYGTMSRILGPAWSLEVEVQFYILVPLFALWIAWGRKVRRPVGVAVILLLTVAIWSLPSSFRQVTSIFVAFPSFAAGMLAAEMEVTSKGALPRGFLADLGLVVGLALLMAIRHGWYVPKHPALTLVGCFLVLCGPLYGRLTAKAASFMPIAIIGGMCYSIYLVNLPVMETTARFVTRVGLGIPFEAYYCVQLVLFSIVALVASTVFYVLIEKPCMNPAWPRLLKERLFKPAPALEAST